MSIIRKTVKLIRRMIGAALSDVHTTMPAQVISYDAATNLVSVQPCVKVMRTDDPDNITTTQLPVIEDIPVQLVGSGICLLSVAPQAGSYGTLHTTERSIANWIVNGGIVEPGSIRKFDISDAIFSPGLYPMAVDGDNGKLQAAINTDRIEMRTRDGNTSISVVDDNSIEVLAVEAISIDSDDETIIQAGTDWAVQYTEMNSAYDNLKADVNNLITAYNAHIHITTATVGIGPVGVIAPTTSTGTPSASVMTAAKVNDVRLP